MSEVNVVEEDTRDEANATQTQIIARICDIAKKCDEIFTEAGVVALDASDLEVMKDIQNVQFTGRLKGVPVEKIPVLLLAVQTISEMVANDNRSLAKAMKALKMFAA